MSISKKIRERLEDTGASFLANDNIAPYIKEGELPELQKEVSAKFKELLECMLIDVEKDHNTKGTADRVAKMFLNEVYKGRYHPMPRLTEFPNYKNLDEIFTIGPIPIRSACSHHFVPIIGNVWIGIKPKEKIIGLSKFNRVVDWIASRPHIQEELSIMIADQIQELCDPEGIGVAVKAQHLCMTWRGVKDAETQMVNSIVRGSFRENPEQKKEFMSLIKAQGF